MAMQERRGQKDQMEQEGNPEKLDLLPTLAVVDLMVKKETTVAAEAKVVPVSMVKMELVANPEMLVLQAIPVLPARKAKSDNKERMDVQENVAREDKWATKDRLEIPESREQAELVGTREHPENPEHPEKKEIEVTTERLEIQELWAEMERSETTVTRVDLDPPDRRVRRVCQDRQVLAVARESRATVEQWELQA